MMTADEDFLRRARITFSKTSKHGDASSQAYERKVLGPLLQHLRPARLARNLEDLQGSSQDTATREKAQEGPEAWELGCGDAARLIGSHETIDMPIFVTGAQSFNWQDGSSPIEQLWRRSPDAKQKMEVQRASDVKDGGKNSTISLADVRSRFSGNMQTENPWKIVGMPSPLPDTILPGFLNGPNASLLHEVRYTVQSLAKPSPVASHQLVALDHTLHHLFPAEGGAITLPQQSTYGVGTWLTCQQGELGCAWLSQSTTDQVKQWMSDQGIMPEGTLWRFKVLRRGETVYFGPGTIYFFITLPGYGKHTLNIAGNVLRKSDVAGWSTVLLQQTQAVAGHNHVVLRNKSEPAPRLPFSEPPDAARNMACLLVETVETLA